MNNMITLPIILPTVAALVMIILRNKIKLHRVLSLVALLSVLAVSVIIVSKIKKDGILSLQLGGWEAPFGVSMVADMFAAILVLVTSAVSICCLIYAFSSIGREREEYYFYPLFLILITGVNGSFLTGDILICLYVLK